ncbi:MAG: antitoxin PrlF [Clostridia bacterium]|nr:antitoxin PrlF [Clostridia bacterium]
MRLDKQFEITKLSSRGQVVIPKEIRHKLRWEAGDHITVEVEGDKVILRRLNLESLVESSSKSQKVLIRY